MEKKQIKETLNFLSKYAEEHMEEELEREKQEKNNIKNALKDGLTIKLKKEHNWGDGNVITAELYFDKELISSSRIESV